jgi:beta-lactamase class A
MDEFRGRLSTLLASVPGRAALHIEEVGGPVLFSARADEPFPAASIIKLPILWAYAQQLHEGRVAPLECRIVPPEAVVGGSGVIQHLAPQPRLRLHDLAVLMIIVSDNTATNLLIDALGLETIQRTIAALGLANTKVQRYLMDMASAALGLDNVVSAADVARLLMRLATSDGLPREHTEAMLEILKGQQHREKLAGELPEDAVVASKSGEIEGVSHDAGIIYRGHRAAVTVALTADLAENGAGLRFCRRVGRLVYDFLASPQPP